MTEDDIATTEKFVSEGTAEQVARLAMGQVQQVAIMSQQMPVSVQDAQGSYIAANATATAAVALALCEIAGHLGTLVSLIQQEASKDEVSQS